MNSIFKELEHAFRNENLPDERKEVLKQIRDYIISGTWTSRRCLAKKVIKAVGLGYTEASKDLGITESGVRLLISRSSNTIREKIGNNIIHAIAYGSDSNFRDAALQFDLVKNNISPGSFIVDGVLNWIPDESSGIYSLKELQKEIFFLRRYTKKYASKELETLDDDKLGFIMSILSSTTPEFMSLRADMFRLIVMYDENI